MGWRKSHGSIGRGGKAWRGIEALHRICTTVIVGNRHFRSAGQLRLVEFRAAVLEDGDFLADGLDAGEV